MIIATAGHVDHGKTSLIKALTGTNTDRLPEEKKRGLTIDIGFAYLPLNDDQMEGAPTLAFIDVPGHEKFVRNMIAGVGMVDIAMLVVAADDGPMPQTLEHIAILQLMAVRSVVVVISKIDLVDSDRVAQVTNAMDGISQHAGFPEAESFALSASDSSAIDSLRNHIIKLASQQKPRKGRGHFRMAIDRCFTISGSGTVVTGTVIGGEVRKEDRLTLLSDSALNGKSARVRGVHAQNQEAEVALVGQRCALNLSGELPRQEIGRGDWLSSDTDSQLVYFIDVLLTPALNFDVQQVKDKKVSPGSVPAQNSLQHWTPAHLHLGTADIPCRIALLEAKEIVSGTQGLARLICDKELLAINGDCFVLRDQSARKTIAGGRVLDPHPPKRGRSKPERLLELQALNSETPAIALHKLLELQPCGISLSRFVRQFGLTESETHAIAGEIELVTAGSDNDLWCLRNDQCSQLQKDVLEHLQDFHDKNPDLLGADSVQIKRMFRHAMQMPVLDYLLQSLVDNSAVTRHASVYRLADREVTLSDSDQKQWVTIEKSLTRAELIPPRVGELSELLDQSVEDTSRFLNRCVAHGKIYKVSDNRYFLPQTLRSLASIAQSLETIDELSVAAFRDKSGMGRNLVVELLEYFDRCKFTQRLGDKRRTMSSAEDMF